MKEQIHKNKLQIPPNFKRLTEGIYMFGNRKIHVMVLKEGLVGTTTVFTLISLCSESRRRFYELCAFRNFIRQEDAHYCSVSVG